MHVTDQRAALESLNFTLISLPLFLVSSSAFPMARIREVWGPNLEAEMRNIRDIIDHFPYIAMVVSPSHFNAFS